MQALTAEQQRDIVQAHQQGTEQRTLAAEYGVSRATISRVVSRAERRAASRHPHGARKSRFRQGHGARAKRVQEASWRSIEDREQRQTPRRRRDGRREVR